MIISLTGFMGCGKSSVGKELRTLLCCNYIDLDEYIETSEGRTIPEIFSSDGEAGFRAIETSALMEVLDQNAGSKAITILSLGGGTLTSSANLEAVRTRTTCVYLQADIDTLVSNLDGYTEGRPMLAGQDLRARISTLMAQRESDYRTAASIIIDITGKTYPAIAGEIKFTADI